MISLLVAVAVGVCWIAYRRRTRVRLSGTSSAAPVFSVQPPTRRLSRRKGEAL